MKNSNLKLDSQDEELLNTLESGKPPAPVEKPKKPKNPKNPKIKPIAKKKKIAKIEYLKDPDSLFINSIESYFTKLQSKSVLVIEIAQSEIRILHLLKIKDRYNIGYWSMQDVTHIDLQRSETILLALRNLIDKKLLNASEVVLCLDGPEIIIRTLTAPKLEGNELRDAVFWKNKNDLPNLDDAALWDYEIIGEKEENKKRVYNILSIIAQDAFVRRQLTLLNEVGIHPKSVIAKPVALASALHMLTYDWALEEKTSVLAEIGRESTQLNFYNNGKLEFVRSLTLGSNKIDHALHNPVKLKDKKIKLQPDKIDIYKQKYGIIPELLAKPSEQTKSFFPYDQLFNFILPVLQMFVSEMKRSFAFYLNSYDREKIDLLFITGGGTKLKNIDKFLETKLKVPTYTIAPSFPSIIQGSYKPGYEYTACFGAGARNKKDFNFLPDDIRKENIYRQAQNTLKITILIVFAFILAFSSMLYYDDQQYSKEILGMESRYNKLQTSEVQYNKVMEQIRIQEKKKSDLLGNINISTKITNILKVFSNLTPSDIALSSIKYYEAGTQKLFENVKTEESMVVIEGAVYKNFLSADITLIEFMNSLKKLNYFKEITLANNTKRINEKIFLFTIHCKI